MSAFPIWAARRRIDPRFALMKSLGAVVYYPMLETTGTVVRELIAARNGAYSNVTVANSAGPFGGLAPLLVPASSSYVDLVACVPAFVAAEGALVCAIKMRASSVWADGVQRYLVVIRVDSSNFLAVYKDTANGRLRFRRDGGGDTAIVTKDSVSETGWMIFGIDWSESGNYTRFFYQGAQEGADQAGYTWTGTPGTARVGTLTNQYHDGWAAEFALFPAPIGAGGHAALAGSFFTA